ncbi:MAG: serine acetyltransferase [Erysipelotrichaceae bacterium]|jgi:serine O-acetyltransferase|nr:serine acetyltransferase [Erysipelotrichaceae bacterium]
MWHNSSIIMISVSNLKVLLKYSLAYISDHNDGAELEECFLNAVEENKASCTQFLLKLAEIKSHAKVDLEFFYASDPAATSLEEIKLAYPGYRAIGIYRIAHALYEQGYRVHARVMSEIGHSQTGIDIHPGAKISYPFFIDHGTGIVIGQTATIGQRVKIYQSVTLGAISLSHAERLREVIRHPQVGNDVTIYAGASILGAIKIGNNVTIGSNVFLTEDVPDNTKVIIGKPQLIYINK